MQCNLPAISVSGGGIPSDEEVGNDSCTTVDANLSHEKLHIPLNGIEAQAKGMSYLLITAVCKEQSHNILFPRIKIPLPKRHRKIHTVWSEPFQNE